MAKIKPHPAVGKWVAVEAYDTRLVGWVSGEGPDSDSTLYCVVFQRSDMAMRHYFGHDGIAHHDWPGWARKEQRCWYVNPSELVPPTLSEALTFAQSGIHDIYADFYIRGVTK